MTDAPFSLEGRPVLVTGAGRGIGRAIAVAAAAAGAPVVGTARSADQLAETGAQIEDAGGSFTPLPWDLAAPEHAGNLAGAALAIHPDLWGVVHGAGVTARKPAVDVRLDEWRRVNAVNVESPFFLTTAVARRQHAAGRGGSHVFVGSLSSSIGLRNLAPYAATKSAVLGVVRTLALEWAAGGVRVNAVGPGYFRTELTEPLLADDERRAWVLGRIPMGRLGDPREVALTVVFLLSEAASYVTGELVNVDGGWLAG